MPANTLTPTQKLPWNWDRHITDVELRKAHALEFIAHFLDRIDGHLEALAGQAQAGNGNTAKIAVELTSLSHVVGQIASKP